MYFSVRSKNDNTFLGTISLAPHHNKTDVEVSYTFLSDFWNMGYAAESIDEVIQFAFQKLAINRIVAETQVKNISSCKLLESLGFTDEERVWRFEAEQIIYSLEKL